MAEEEFQDFSYASNWERFVGQLEQTLRNFIWTENGNKLDDQKMEVQIKHKLQFRREPYKISLHTFTSVPKYPSLSSPEIAPEDSLIENVTHSEHSFSHESLSSDGEVESNFEGNEINLTTAAAAVDPNSKVSISDKSVRADLKSRLFVSSEDQFSDHSDSDISRWFGISRYIIMTPGNYTGRVLDSQEIGTLSSAAAVALSSILPVALPILIPVFDQYRDAYSGIAIVEGKTVFFETDSSHLSGSLAEELKTKTRRLSLFASHMGTYCIGGAMLCSALAGNYEINPDSPAANFRISLSLCATYKILLPVFIDSSNITNFETNGEEEAEASAIWRDCWDNGCVWQPWAAQVDPIASLELDLICKPYALSLPLDSTSPGKLAYLKDPEDIWRLYVLAKERMSYISWSIFSGTKQYKRIRLCMPRVRGIYNKREAGGSDLKREWSEQYDHQNTHSLSARLKELIDAGELAESARSVGDLISKIWWEENDIRSPAIPPEETLQQSIQDMFGNDKTKAKFMTHHIEYNKVGDEENEGFLELESGCFKNAAPVDSLVWRLALHSVVYRNARAVALLWSHFVHMVRFKYWEKSKLIPICESTNSNDPLAPDTNTCLIHQKLEFLNICIHRRNLLEKKNETEETCGNSANEEESVYESISDEEKETVAFNIGNTGVSNGDDRNNVDGEQREIDKKIPQSAIGILENCFLEKYPNTPINIPKEQLPPVFTSDMVEEQQVLQAALQESPVDSERAARMQASMLLSDMAAFKAANPGCVIEDFVKWHSPKDWIISKTGSQGQLSERMSVSNNNWHKFWNEVSPCPASDQKPLIDPFTYGERALHYLETINPHDLFSQLSRIALVACFKCLERSRMTSKPWAKSEFKNASEIITQYWASSTSIDNALNALTALERIVVAGESLSRRLPGCHQTLDLLMSKILLITNETENASDDCKHNSYINVPLAERDILLHVVTKRVRREDVEGEEEVEMRECILQREWLYTCESVYDEEGCKNRMYIKEGVDETRVATVIFSQ